jgi:DNA-binding NarL/FixJ family response regulator
MLVSMGIAGEHDSFWLIRSLREEFPFLHVLACGGNTEGMTVSQALFTGADGFVDKGAFPEDFVAAIKQAANGGTVLEGLPVDCLGELAEVLETWTPPEPPSLTEREIEVIAVAAEGLTARQIGTRLGLRERTVTTHLGKIYKKLGAQSRVSAIATAHRSGIIVRSRNG